MLWITDSFVIQKLKIEFYQGESEMCLGITAHLRGVLGQNPSEVGLASVSRQGLYSHITG